MCLRLELDKVGDGREPPPTGLLGQGDEEEEGKDFYHDPHTMDEINMIFRIFDFQKGNVV